jgi:predicted nucleic acid-binding protein
VIAIADSGFVFAVAHIRDQRHGKCAPVYFKQERIFLPQSTLAEVGYLLTREGGNRMAAHFLVNLPKSKYEVVALEAQDFARTAEILQQYSDARLDFVDATIIAVAERLKVSTVLTIDQQDFRLFRPRHTPYFEILPEQS